MLYLIISGLVLLILGFSVGALVTEYRLRGRLDILYSEIKELKKKEQAAAEAAKLLDLANQNAVALESHFKQVAEKAKELKAKSSAFSSYKDLKKKH